MSTRPVDRFFDAGRACGWHQSTHRFFGADCGHCGASRALVRAARGGRQQQALLAAVEIGNMARGGGADRLAGAQVAAQLRQHALPDDCRLVVHGDADGVDVALTLTLDPATAERVVRLLTAVQS